MARCRNIKPGFFKNEDLAECSAWARLCFAGLWTLADRDGRLEDRPKRIKGDLFAYDTIDVVPLLAELEMHGFILRYKASGLGIIQILTFPKHQNPHHREPQSNLPSPESLGLLPPVVNAKPGAQCACEEDIASDKPEVLEAIVDLPTTPSRAVSGALIPDSGKKKGVRKRSPGFDASEIELPPWLDRELWSEWVADRRERHKPITERGARQQLQTLADFRKAGHTPERTIRHAISSGNQGLYPPPKVGTAQAEPKPVETWKPDAPLTPEQQAAAEAVRVQVMDKVRRVA